MIAWLLPPLVAPGLALLAMDFGKNKLPDAQLQELAPILIVGGVFTFLFSLPYAVLLEVCYGLPHVRPASKSGVLISMLLGLVAGIAAGLLLCYDWFWRSGWHISARVLGISGATGIAVGALVAGVIFICDGRMRRTR
jgi:hypothetical protein